MYFPVTCRKWILKEMSVTSRECLHNVVIQISDNILYVNSDIPLQKLRCTLCYLVWLLKKLELTYMGKPIV